MNDLPPETIDEEPLIPYIEEAQTEETKITVDDIAVEEYPSFLSPLAKTKASRADLFQLAHILHEEYPNGFTWKDYATMIDICIDYLHDCSEMTLFGKREAILTTLNYVIAQTQQPFLPESSLDPLFESLIVPFIDLALEARIGKITLRTERPEQIKAFRTEKLTMDRLQEFSKEITRLWQSGYKWHDFAQAARVSILFLLTFEDISRFEIREGLITILQTLIDKADSEHLPEDFNEAIFNTFIEAFSEVLIPIPKKNGCS